MNPAIQKTIFGIVCETLSVDQAVAMSRDRHDEVALCRQITTALAVERGLSISQASRFFGRHFTTGIKAIESVKNRMETKPSTRQIVAEIKSRVEAILGRKYKFGGEKPLRERIHVTAVRQHSDGLWIRLQAANSKQGTLPMLCIMPGDTFILEETENPPTETKVKIANE